jgi:hypothetical protein
VRRAGRREHDTESGGCSAPLSDSPYGNTAIAEITYDADSDGVPIHVPVDMRVAVGEQFCSGSAIAQACVAGRT